MFPKNGTSAVIREGNILKMQRKQKMCTPLPSNKNSRYYRPRVNVSNKNLTPETMTVFSGKTTKCITFWAVYEGFRVLVWQGRFVSKAHFLQLQHQQQQASEKES